MTIRQTIASLSPEARQALLNHGRSHIGAVTGAVPGDAGKDELVARKLVGPRGGLTIKGSAAADILKGERDRELFG